MNGTPTHPPLRDRLVRSREYFEGKLRSAAGSERDLLEALSVLSSCVEEIESLIAYQKVQLDEVRRGRGHHAETSGNVPHARRSR